MIIQLNRHFYKNIIKLNTITILKVEFIAGLLYLTALAWTNSHL